MKFLKYIWKDVERGENIDLYAQIRSSFTLRPTAFPSSIGLIGL